MLKYKAEIRRVGLEVRNLCGCVRRWDSELRMEVRRVHREEARSIMPLEWGELLVHLSA